MAETRASVIAEAGANPNNPTVDGSTAAASGANRAVATGEASDPEKGGTPVAGGPSQQDAVATQSEREKQLATLLKESQKAQKDAMKAVSSTTAELNAAQEEADALKVEMARLEGELAAARASAPFGAPERGTVTVNAAGDLVA